MREINRSEIWKTVHSLMWVLGYKIEKTESYVDETERIIFKNFNKKMKPNNNPTSNKERFEARLKNQLRIHWKWLIKSNSDEVKDFVMSIYNNNPTHTEGTFKCCCGDRFTTKKDWIFHIITLRCYDENLLFKDIKRGSRER